LTTKRSTTITDADFMFENALVKIAINRSYPKIELAGLEIGPFEEGKEYDVRFWIAYELEKAGIARFREEDLIAAVELYKIHWKERVQSVKQIASLPLNFYPKLRRYLGDLKKKAVRNPEKMREHEKAMRHSRDIINCRLKKIVSLASASAAQTNQIVNNLTVEEHSIYKLLRTNTTEWRTRILEEGAES
jgi:hypothetical protein